MAMCDDPGMVRTGQDWAAASTRRPRIPIFVTANDLSCLYAPLVREGRMDKFYFSPTREEKSELLARHFEPDLNRGEAIELLDAFPGQPLDFFSAVKSNLADRDVAAWIRWMLLHGSRQ